MVQQVQPGGRVVGLQQGLQGLNGVQGLAFGSGYRRPPRRRRGARCQRGVRSRPVQQMLHQRLQHLAQVLQQLHGGHIGRRWTAQGFFEPGSRILQRRGANGARQAAQGVRLAQQNVQARLGQQPSA